MAALFKNPGTKRPQESFKPTKYHAIIFIAAAMTLIIGGAWRGGKSEGEPESELTLIEELRSEVEGLQTTLKGSELGSIRSTMSRAAAEAARSVVAVRPALGMQTLRSIPVYGDSRITQSALPSSSTMTPGVSGIVLDREGYILTSANALKMGRKAQFVLGNGRLLEGEILGVDPKEFLALARVSTVADITVPDLSRRTEALKPGEWLIQQGRSPSGTESVSLCQLQSLRPGANNEPIALLDGSAAPEIDGGALIDLSGRIVGVYAAPPGAPAFVIPIERALRVAARLKNSPVGPAKSWIGLDVQTMDAALQAHFKTESSVIVTHVEAGSPAARAGIQPADIIESVDGTKVNSGAEFMDTLRQREPGATARVYLWRAKRKSMVTITVDRTPQDSDARDGVETLVLKLADGSGDGPTIVEATPYGVANRLGLTPGDSILALNGRAVRKASDAVAALKAASAAQATLLEARRGRQFFFVAINEEVRISE